ncbi:MAG: hypothetical protein WC819_06300 [Parcubacteria group bacterium]|jgi:hypothetical protein
MKQRNFLYRNIFNDIAYWHNAIVHWVAIATFLINVIVWCAFLFYVHPSDVPIRLQYNVFFGTSLHALWWHAYILACAGLVFFMVDLIVGYVLYNAKERVAAYIVLLGALFANVALLIAAISIVFNNFFL